MGRGVKIFLAAILAIILLLLGMALTVTQWLPRLAGIWLPADTQIALNGHPRWRAGGLWFPDIRYIVGDCELARVSDASLRWQQQRWQAHADAVTLDSECFAKLPSTASTSDAPTSLAQWQSLLPPSQLTVGRFSLLPWQAWAGRLDITLSPQQQQLHWQGEKLQLDAQLDGRVLRLTSLQVTDPALPSPVNLQGEFRLPEFADGLPDSGTLAATLSVSAVPAPLTLHLDWQQQSGIARVEAAGQQTPLITLPWEATPEKITVNGGQWQWPWAAQTLSGGLSVSVKDFQQGLSATEITGRLNVLTKGKGGIGNVVASFGPGKLDWQTSQLPFRITGTSKLQDLMFFAGLPGEITGPVLDPVLRLSPGSLLRLRGKLLSTLEVDEARWPLAGVTVSTQGIEGRLQAILKAHDPQMGQFTLHLDGRAEGFWPDKGRWDWRYWGNGNMTPLKARWDLNGRGSWHDTLIKLDSLSTGFDKLSYGLADMGAPRLTLAKPILWQRDSEHPAFSGSLLLHAQETRFANGGYLPPSEINIEVTGRDPAWFLWRGDLRARAIGPVRMSGRWDGERLRGQAWWPEQTLTVFQPLISPALKMDIREGTLRAQVAFSAASDQGFEAGGHWVVKAGAVRMPDNDISGIDFALPFRLKNSEWQLGTKRPVALRIKSIENQIALQNFTADLQGTYPWQENKPLTLSHVGVELLGGEMKMDKLAMPQHEAAVVTLRGIDMSRLIAAIKVNQFALSGKVNGELPLWLEHPQWLVKEGWIANDGPLTLRMDKEVADAISANNMAAGAALDWLRYMEISRSWATINLSNLGILTMKSDVEGNSRFSDKDQRVSLHYSHEENLFQLWRSLRFGDNLQSWVEDNATLPSKKETRDVRKP
ncbi:hypothetical protein CIG19_02975 [Enterobacterales bacterium CwR94]|nr:hypothetical protein CIG19_02975 [Enterobacterales bacterium CwR94]